MSKGAPTPPPHWRRRMQLAFAFLSLSPDEFWSMSLAEWACAQEGLLERLGLSGGGEPMRQDDLAALMRRYPDRTR